MSDHEEEARAVPDAEVRDPVNCRACLAAWIADTRAMLEAMEQRLDHPETLPSIEVAHGTAGEARARRW
jgi:hypothetical protein